MTGHRIEPNVYRVEGSVAFIGLRGGYEARIDLEDLGRVMPFHWTARVRDDFRANRGTYGRFTIYVYQTGYVDRTLHRLIMDAEPHRRIDHKNWDGLDNRKENLRYVTNSENMQNRPTANRNSKTGIRGVSRFQNKKAGLTYWAARVWLPADHPSGKKSIMKYFPYNEEGLRQAEGAAQAIRLENMTHSEV